MKFPAGPTVFVVSLLLIGRGAGSVAGTATSFKKPSGPVAANPAPVKSTASTGKKPGPKPVAKAPVQTKKLPAVTRPVKHPVPAQRQTATLVRNAPRTAPMASPRTSPAVATKRSKPPDPKVPVIERNTSEFIDINFPDPASRGRTSPVATPSSVKKAADPGKAKGRGKPAVAVRR